MGQTEIDQPGVFKNPILSDWASVHFRKPITPEQVEAIKNAEGVEKTWTPGRYHVEFIMGKLFLLEEVTDNIQRALREANV